MSENNIRKREFEVFQNPEESSLADAFHISSLNLKNLNQIVLTDDILFKNDQFVVSPIVFCKKVPISSLEGASPRLIILENLLRIVCQSYYKSECSIGNLIQEIEKKGKFLL